MATVINGNTGIDKVQDNTITSTKIVDGSVGFADLLGTDWENSKTANGYQKLPSGLIMQWGKILSPVANSTNTITYSIPFPNSILSVSCNWQSANTTTSSVAEIGSTKTYLVTNSSMQIVCGDDSTGVALYWFAIGY